MKKVLALLLAVLMLASIGCAWAEGTAEEPAEITFQGIPWGSSLEETAEALIALGLISDQTEMQYVGGGLLPFFNENGPILLGEMSRIEGTLKAEATPVYAIEVQDFSVAGYRTTGIAFNFAFDGEQTKLITVYLVLENPGGMLNDDMEADLALKITQVYGEGVEAHGMHTYRAGQTFMVMGDDFTGLSGKMLLYATGEGYALAAEASRNIVISPEPTVDPSTLDTNGL